jgi:ATP-dependent DNA helicase DinG
MRGLQERLKDLIADDDVAQSALEETLAARARWRAKAGWRASNGGGRAAPAKFFSAAYQHVRARSEDRDAFYSLEADTEPLGDDTIAAARWAPA